MIPDGDLSDYVTDTEGDVYAIRGVPEEVLAVVFAYVSRSPRSFRENLLKVTAERAGEFHEKWVLQYGHASVAEHAVIHLGIENISRYASGELEQSRLISVTEYSQRYQEPRPSGVHLPREIASHAHEPRVRTRLAALFDAYLRLLDGLAAHLRGTVRRGETEEEAAYAARLRRRAFEDARYVLPLATTTSLGLTANAREMELLISRCLSHRAAELRRLGESMREASSRVAPTLIKYAGLLNYRSAVARRADEETKLAEGESAGRAGGARAGTTADATLVRLVDWTGREAGERAALRAVVGAFLEPGAASAEALRGMLDAESREALAARYGRVLGVPGEHEALPRALECVQYTFEILLSEAAWHQLLRHRMMSSFPGAPRADLGVRIPPLIQAAGLGALLEDAAAGAAETWSGLLPDAGVAAPYLVTNAHLRRVRLVMNLRQFGHLARLRSTRQAQWDIRAVAAEMIARVREVHPSLVAWLPSAPAS